MVTPSRITLARKRRGLTLAELSDQADYGVWGFLEAVEVAHR